MTKTKKKTMSAQPTKKQKRIWYVECMNEEAHDFIGMNIYPNPDDTKLAFDREVEDSSSGKRILVRKDLLEIDITGLRKLRNSKKSLGLEFNVFMQESKGAKITSWTMSIP